MGRWWCGTQELPDITRELPDRGTHDPISHHVWRFHRRAPACARIARAGPATVAILAAAVRPFHRVARARRRGRYRGAADCGPAANALEPAGGGGKSPGW